jgi:hypothetical protein
VDAAKIDAGVTLFDDYEEQSNIRS